MNTPSDRQTIVMYAMKGGSGTTVTAALTALRAPGDTLIVDLGGDMADVLGTRPPTWTLDDFLLDPSVGDLDDIVININPTTRLLPSARPIQPGSGSPTQRRVLTDWLDRQPGTIVIDAGTGVPPNDMIERADQTLAVTRPCYLSLVRAARTGFVPDGIIVVRDHRRALGPSDIERSLNAPIIAIIDLDPDIARIVDAGLLVARSDLHGRQLDNLHQSIEPSSGLDRWRELKPTRYSPDIDYGMRWRSANDPNRRWRVSWNSGSGDLYAVDQHDNNVIDLATFEDQTTANHAIEGWAKLHHRADGLDRLRTRFHGGSPGHDLALP